jgi:hypothetical protein
MGGRATNFVTESLRRHAVTISLSLLLGLGVAYYALGYLPAREEYLRARYFRVMSRIGENLQNKGQAYGKRVDAMRREIQHGVCQRQLSRCGRVPSDEKELKLYDTVANLLRQKWQRQDLNPPVFEGLTRPGSANRTRNVGELVGISWLSARQRVQFEHVFDAWQSVISSTPIKDLVGDLRRSDAFQEFLVIGPEASEAAAPPLNQVYYSTFPAPAVIQLPTEASSKVPGWLQDTTGILTPRQVELAINGQSYQLFVQPIRVGGTTTWLLVGAVSTAEFRNKQLALPDSVLEVALAVILLGLLALPYMKIVFMNARERLSQNDVVLCGLSLVFGTTFLMLLSLSPVVKYDLEPDLLDAQLQQLSEAVEKSLIQELQELRATLRTAEAGLLSKKAQKLLTTQEEDHAKLRDLYLKRPPRLAENYVPADTLLPATVGLDSCTRVWQPSIDRIQWLDQQGEGLAFVDNLSARFNPSLLDREFMQQALRGDLWLFPRDTLPDSKRVNDTLFRLASVVRYGRKGEKAAVFVRPSRQRLYFYRETKKGRPSAKPDSLQSVLSIYTTQLWSLSAPLLPPGYSFCVLDEQGEVQFHSDKRLDLSENLFQDTEPVALLRTALLTKETTQGIIQYQGHHQRVRIQQLGTWPLYLMTMADLRAVQARQMQTLSLAATLLGAIGLGHLLFLGLYVLVLPRQHRILNLGYSLRRLWPRPEREAAYWRIVAALAGGMGLLILFAELTPSSNRPFLQPFLLLLLPIYAFGFGFWQLQLPTDKRSRALARVTNLVLVEVIACNLLALYWAGRSYIYILLFQVALLALFLGLFFLNKEQRAPVAFLFKNRFPRAAAWLRRSAIAQVRPPSWLQNRNRNYWFPRAYALMMLGWVMVVSILPPIYCYYHLAYGVERELQLHYAHLRLGQQLQMPLATPLKERPNSREQKLRKAYLSFFFDTRYDPLATLTDTTQPSRSIKNFRKLLRWLHPSFDTLAQAPQSTLPLDTLAILLATEHHEQKGGEYDSLQTYIPRPNGTYARFTAQVSDLAWGGKWYLPQPIVEGEAREIYVARWLRQVGLLLLLGIVLYMLLRVLTRQVFNLHLLILKDLVPQEPPLPAARQYLIDPFDSTYSQKNSANSSVLRLDCRQLSAQSPNSSFLKKAEKFLNDGQNREPRIIALEHFDYRPQDPELTRAKIEVLEHLSAALPPSLRLVVVSKVHPILFADCGHSREQCPNKEQHQLVWALGDRLLDALADFTFAYESFHPQPPLCPDRPWQFPAAAPSLAQKLTNEEQSFRDKTGQALQQPGVSNICLEEKMQPYLALRWFVKVECRALPILRPLEEELEIFLLDSARRAHIPTEEAIILAIQRRAQLQLRQLWETLSPHERYLLYDLAQDGLVNGRDSLIINDLLQRGLLLYDRLGLRIVNETFRSFILVGLPQEQALRIEREAQQEAQSHSAWNQRSFPVFLLLSAAGLFIFVTQRSALNEIQSFLTAVLSIAPLAYRFISFSASPTDPVK